MTMKSTQDSPILVTGAAGDIGAIGRNLTAMLLAKGAQGARLGPAGG
jgi:nucleoside-diphosphate-sugar epimerase